jgi:hypothetical protein
MLQVVMEYMDLLADQLCPALGTNSVQTALTGYMFFFMPTFWADAISTGTGFGSIAFSAPAPTLSLPLSKTVTQ